MGADLIGAILERLFNPPAGMLRRRAAPDRCRDAACRWASRFHGVERGMVVELSEAERRLPRTGVLVGEVLAIEYRAPAPSRRSGVVWRHETTELGSGKRSKRRPLLVADPQSGRVALVKAGSAFKFDPERGLIG